FGLRQVFPGMILGSLLGAAMSYSTPIVILGVTSSRIFEVYLAYMLLVAGENGKFRLKKLKDVTYFISMAGVLPAFVSSAFCIMLFYLTNSAKGEPLPNLWLSYFMGTLLG